MNLNTFSTISPSLCLSVCVCVFVCVCVCVCVRAKWKPTWLHLYSYIYSEFECLAIKVLDECNSIDPEKAALLIERKYSGWGNMDCLELAALAENKVSHYFILIMHNSSRRLIFLNCFSKEKVYLIKFYFIFCRNFSQLCVVRILCH